MRPDSESDQPDSDLPQGTKHRKRGVARKPFAVRWTWHGDATKLSPLSRHALLVRVQRYATERAARQALEDWSRGRGIWGAVCRPPDWVATFEDTTKSPRRVAP